MPIDDNWLFRDPFRYTVPSYQELTKKMPVKPPVAPPLSLPKGRSRVTVEPLDDSSEDSYTLVAEVDASNVTLSQESGSGFGGTRTRLEVDLGPFTLKTKVGRVSRAAMALRDLDEKAWFALKPTERERLKRRAQKILDAAK